MAQQSSTNGTTSSFSNTPQAKADLFSFNNTVLGDVLLLDVMANDLGGNAKSLWSVDNGVNNSGAMSGNVAGDLLTKDTARTEAATTDASAHGAKIWIGTDGKVSYDASTLDAAFKAQIQALPQGQTLTDTFIYAIQLGNGTLSWTTVTVQFQGTATVNHAPVAVADTASAVEAGGVNNGTPGVNPTGNVLTNDTDVDSGDTKTVTTTGAFAGLYGTLTLNANGSYTYTLNNANPVTNALAQNETVSDIFSYTMRDTAGATSSSTLTVNITGANDAPVVSAAVTGGGNEGSGTASVNLLQFASDADHGAVLHIENVVWDEVPGNMPAGFTVAGNAIQVDTNSLAYNAMAQGETFTTHFTYNVVDEFGAVTVQHATVTVTGTNDAPTVSAAVTGGGNEGSGTASVDLLQFASDVDHGAVLHVSNVVWDEVPGNMPAGFTVAGNAIQVDTNSLAYDALAQGETFTTHFTYNVVDEFGAVTVQHATVTVTGTNDAPTVTAAVAGGGNEGSGTASVDLLQFASDVDHGAVLHVSNVVWDEVPGNMPAGFTVAGNAIQVDTNTLAYDALAQGETFTTHFTYDVVDEFGASVQQHATVTLTGTNDAPVISGVSTGAIQEDGVAFTTGALTATDPDHGATKTWSVVGGTTPHTADYHVLVDEFRVTKNGSTYFDDTFSDGNPPPSITGVPDPSVFYSIRTGNTVTETDGHAVLDGAYALPAAFGTSAGHLVKLFTNFDNSNTTLGLKKGDSFSVEGRFELVPLDMFDSYGVRFDDRVLPTGLPAHPGDDGIALSVTRSSITGNVIVRLAEIDYVAGSSTTLSTALLNAAAGDDQIVLKLTHDATHPGVLTASYQLFDDGVATGSGTLAGVGQIFGTETPGDLTDDENWTQAAFEAGDGLANAQVQNGAYGWLSLNQNGTWTYDLANTHANVQALAQDETVHDTFQVQVTDQFGASDTETVDVTVTGTNDAPVIAEGVTTGAVEEDNNPLATGHLDATDVDHGASISWSVVGGQPANSDFIFAIDEFKVIKGNAVLFDDNFSDGNAPPSAPNLNAGTPTPTPTSYAIPAGTTFVETLDHVIMYGPLGPAPTPGIGLGAPNFVSESATLLTNNDPAQGTAGLGLRIGTTFTVEGRFEGLVPEDNREGYGIRLTDRNTPTVPSASNPTNLGNDVLELSVRRDINGNLAIQFRDLDIENNTTPMTLGSVTLTPAMIDGNQVILRLNHATAGSHDVTASFEIVDHDGNVVLPTTVIQNFAHTGPAVGQAFTDELYTRAQFIGSEPVENISYLHGQYGALTIDQSGNWKYLLDNNSASVQALAEGEVVTDTFTVRATDEHGAFDSKTINVTVTGDNDAPKITSAATTGSVQEDGIQQATGLLTATDVDHNAIKTWNVTSVNTGNTGNSGHTTDYRVTIDEFKIVKVNGGTPTTIFDDTFTGTFPPTGPGGGQPGYIGTNNQFTGADGRAVMDDEHSGIGFSISNPALDFTGLPTGGIGNWAQIGTNIDPLNTTNGLKSGMSFSISGVYDLIHSEAGYGIRLANTNGAIQFAGNDVVDFNVRTGGPFGPSALYLQLTQIDFTVPNGATMLQQLQLTPSAADDQILLTLTHDATVANGVVKASFSLLNHGVVDYSGLLFAEGHIFNNTNWTRGGFEATAPGNTSSFVGGLYGALAINQSGNWTYNLNNNLASVQALAQGQTVTDTFTVTVSDEHGASDTRTINVAVNGTNDAPVAAAITADANEDVGNPITLTANYNDVDAGDGHTYSVNTAGTLGMVINNNDGTFSYNPNGQFEWLALDATTTDSFSYTVTDSHGLSSTATATVTIHGENDTIFIADGTVTPSATKAPVKPNELIVGSGIPTSHFGLLENDSGIELGMQVIYRQGPTVTTADNYNDGVLHFTANSGAQSTANGSSSNNATRAAWNFDYSIATGLSGQTTNLDSYTFKMLVDVDPTVGVNYRTLTLESGGAGTSGHQWRDQASGQVVIADDAGNSNVTQNSQNYAFYSAFLTSPYGTVNNFSGPAHFDISLQAYKGATLLAANNIVVDVNSSSVPPNQAPIVVVPVGGTPFTPAGTFAAGPVPGYVAIGDVNGDGKADLAVSNFPGHTTVSILLGDGLGGFGAPTQFSTGGLSPSSVVLADFNGDGKLDLATTNQDTATVAVLLNNGSGSFGAPSTLFAQNPTSVTTGDFNEDGRVDLVVGQSIGNQISLFLGNGNGTFGPAQSLSPGFQVMQTAVGDLNHDGNLDIVAAANLGTSGPRAVVLLGHGDGTFDAPTHYLSANAGASAASIALGDFNGDGNLDIAQADTGAPGVSIMLGNGAGGFGPRANYGTIMPANSTADLVVADLNGDGKQDLALGNTAVDGVTVMYGNGNGSFQPEVVFATGNEPTTLAVGNINPDGLPDLVTPNLLDNTVSVLLNRQATTTNEDTPLTIHNVNVVDPDALGDPIQVTLSVGHGALSFNSTTGLTTSGLGTGTVTFNGSVLNIDNALAGGVIYTPAANYNGSDALTVTANDLGHNGPGGALSDTDVFNFVVNSVNDLPVVPLNNAIIAPFGAGPISFTIPASTDVDGALSYMVSQVPTVGTLTLAGNPVLVATPIGPGQVLTYTPPASGSPTLTAFAYQVNDGFVSITVGTAIDLRASGVSLTEVSGAGNDILVGGTGNDLLMGGAGADALDGGLNFDIASYSNSPVGLTVDLLTPASNTGDAAGDTYANIESLRGSAFTDTLRGDNNNNQLEGGAGADILDGRGGNDYASYSTAASGITASLANQALNTGDAANDVYISLENLRGSAFDDTLFGDNGNNALRGGLGADTLNGGNGFDTAEYSNASFGITIDLANPGNNTGEATNDVYISIENLRGGAFNDILRGNSSNNLLEGGVGADTLDGGAGSGDLAWYATASIGVVASLSNPASNTGDAAGDVYISIEGLVGSNFNDVLTGDAGNNTLRGGLGADTLNGGGGFDLADYSSASIGVTADLSNSTNNTGEAAGDTYNAISGLIGSNSGDVLTGDGNSNFIRGSLGADFMTGGGASDTFAFNAANEGADTINDFVSGSDFFQISASGFGGGLVSGGPATLVTAPDLASASNPGSGGYFIFDNTAPNQSTVYWDATGGSGTDAVAIATLIGVTTLLPSDFHVV